MYYTKKIQLELKESEYNALIAYIEDYQQYLKAMVDFMHRSGNIQYNSFQFPTSIQHKNRHYLYRLALKKYRAELHKKSFQYNCCTSFVFSTFFISENLLTMKLGRAANKNTICATLIDTDMTHDWRSENMIRLDILRKDQIWYACFTIYTS